jgi:CRP-like cAMP-binding protein
VIVTAAYEAAPQRVIRHLREAVDSVPGVSDMRAPTIRISAFNDWSVSYEILYWVEDALRHEAIDAQIRERAWYVFARHGLSMPYPHQVEVPYAPASHNEPIPDVKELRLAEVPLLQPLTTDERRLLAERSRVLVFGPGERVLAAGGQGGTMYVVLEGRVEVIVPQASGAAVRVAEIGPGEVIGEMSLLTGDPRSADVRAMEEVEVLEVGKAAMREVMTSNDALAEALSEQMTRRTGERSEFLASVTAGPGGQESPASLLARIRRFFDLG